MKIEGDSEAARELMQSMQTAWAEIIKTHIPEIEKAKEKLGYGDLGYGAKAAVKEANIISILTQMKGGVKHLPRYIELLERK